MSLFSITTVEGAIESFTYATIKVVDKETTGFPGHASIRVVKTLEGKVISDVTGGLIKSPQKVPIAVSFDEDGTQISITVSEKGYLESEPFVYEVTPQTPDSGQLFEHTFIIEPLETTNDVPEESNEFMVIIDDSSYPVTVTSKSSVETVRYDDSTRSLVFDVNGSQEENSVTLSISKEMMSGTFTVFIDGFAVAQLAGNGTALSSFHHSESGDNNSIQVYFGSGAHQISMTATTVVPEFPIAILLAASVIGVIVVITRFTRKVS